jgi:hypothetical protein
MPNRGRNPYAEPVIVDVQVDPIWTTLLAAATTTGSIMDSPTSSFDSYEQDFKQLISSVHDKLHADRTNESIGQSRLLFSVPQHLILKRLLSCVGRGQTSKMQVLEEWTWSWTKLTKWYVTFDASFSSLSPLIRSEDLTNGN